MKQAEGLSDDNLITHKTIFAKYGLPSKLMSYAGTKFVSEEFHDFCSYLNIYHEVSSYYNHQSNGQAGICIMFVKQIMKKSFETNADVEI